MWPKNMGLAQGNDWATAIAGGSEAVVGQARLTVLAISGQHPGLASIAGRSFFLSGQLLLGNLSKTVVVVGNTPHDRPSFLVCHLIGNRASFLCTEAPMLRVPETNFLQGITSISGARCSGDLPSSPPTDYRSRHQHRSYRVPWSRCIF